MLRNAGGTLIRLGTGVLNANVADALGTGVARVENGTLSLNVANARGAATLDLAGGTVRLVAQSSTSTAGSTTGASVRTTTTWGCGLVAPVQARKPCWS